jgi:hypothetical protein
MLFKTLTTSCHLSLGLPSKAVLTAPPIIWGDCHGFRSIHFNTGQWATVEGAGNMVNNSVELVLVQISVVLDGFQAAF